jgi:Bacterial EndoU nuclease
MVGLTMPGGDPGVLQQLAARLEAVASGAGDLAAATNRVSTSVRLSADWTGDAADSYTAFAGGLSEGATAAEGPLSRIALSVRDYAGYLEAAQQKVAAYTTAAENAQISGDDPGYVSAAEAAGQDAASAITAWQAAGDRAAAEVSAAAGELGGVFGAGGPVRAWLDGQSPETLTELAGMNLPGTPGEPLGFPGLQGDPGAPDLGLAEGDPLPPDLGLTEGYPLLPDLGLVEGDPIPPDLGLVEGDPIPPEGLLGPLINRSESSPGDESQGDNEQEDPWDNVVGEHPEPGTITAEDAQTHILYGDDSGQGGHIYDSGMPGKTVFPEDWGPQKIMNEVNDIANNPDQTPVEQRDGTFLATGTRNGVTIDVIIDPDGNVKTAYPTGGPGVNVNGADGVPHPLQG